MQASRCPARPVGVPCLRLSIVPTDPLSPADYSLFYYFLLWLVLVVVSLTFIFIHGIEYVNWPRLLPLSDIVHYDGPGFRSGHHGKGLGIRALDAAVKPVAMKQHRRGMSKLEEGEMGRKAE